MYLPSVYTVEEIKDWDVQTESSPGTWLPARPIFYWSLGRLVMAWRVLLGRYDALDWGPRIDAAKMAPARRSQTPNLDAIVRETLTRRSSLAPYRPIGGTEYAENTVHNWPVP